MTVVARTGPDAFFDRNGLEILDRATCLDLLSTVTFGRVGITLAALPVILPVNFRLVGDRIMFRTGMGTKLDAATRGAVVAFEADSFEAFSHSGWSVSVTGTAQEITDAAEIEHMAEAKIPRWARSHDERLVAVPAEIVSGRRIVPGMPCSQGSRCRA